VSAVLSEINRKQKKHDNSEAYLVLENIKDTYTFLMVDPLSRAGVLAVFIFLVQVLSFGFAVSDMYLENPYVRRRKGKSKSRKSDFFKNSNVLNVPKRC